MDVAARARAESLFRSRRRRARLRAAPDRSRAADDVVGEVFVVAARRAGDVPADALPWLLAYTRRLIANRRRSSTRRAALLDRVRTLRPPAQAEPVDSTGRLTRGLARLSESDREVPMLIAWEGLDPERAARVLDCSRSAFAMRLHRARKRLAAALEQPATAAVPDHLPAHVDPEEVVLMDDLIAELTAENPVPACEAPPIDPLAQARCACASAVAVDCAGAVARAGDGGGDHSGTDRRRRAHSAHNDRRGAARPAAPSCRLSSTTFGSPVHQGP